MVQTTLLKQTKKEETENLKSLFQDQKLKIPAVKYNKHLMHAQTKTIL